MSAKRLALILAGLMVLTATTSAQAGPFMEWLCGCSSNMSSQSTYAPAYVPTAVVAAPVSGCSSFAQQTTYYAPAVTLAPVTTYRPVPIVPRPTTTYYAPTGYNPYSRAPVTVYRPMVPVQPVVTTTRLIPYTSYRMVYPTAVSYYGVAPVYNVAPVYAAPPAVCPVPQIAAPSVESYNPPVVGPSMEGDATEVPSLPPGQPSTVNYPPLYNPSQVIVEKPYDNPPPPVTRQENKPVTPNEPTPAPKDESKEKDSGKDNSSTKTSNPPVIQHNSITNPPRDDSGDRTTMRAVRQVSRTASVAPKLEVRVLSEDLWRPAKD